jgi:hypothetical protein
LIPQDVKNFLREKNAANGLTQLFGHGTILQVLSLNNAIFMRGA